MGRPQDPVPPGGPVDGDWCLLVEENTGQLWEISHIRTFPTREAALADGAMMARRYQPRHPMSERKRHIYRTGEDLWTVSVQGVTRSFHFRLTVARAEAP